MAYKRLSKCKPFCYIKFFARTVNLFHVKMALAVFPADIWSLLLQYLITKDQLQLWRVSHFFQRLLTPELRATKRKQRGIKLCLQRPPKPSLLSTYQLLQRDSNILTPGKYHLISKIEIRTVGSYFIVKADFQPNVAENHLVEFTSSVPIKLYGGTLFELQTDQIKINCLVKMKHWYHLGRDRVKWLIRGQYVPYSYDDCQLECPTTLPTMLFGVTGSFGYTGYPTGPCGPTNRSPVVRLKAKELKQNSYRSHQSKGWR